ncbi:hypothetical protein [Methanolobus sp.]|jgi:hypothetical protein|uniref:hypothetical protein n=1 Tax=Methanolobus sp. TaxID=1874737 RepID=UPI0025E10788|nr:hypothetical protein [Methanolobus sp.]
MNESNDYHMKIMARFAYGALHLADTKEIQLENTVTSVDTTNLSGGGNENPSTA